MKYTPGPWSAEFDGDPVQVGTADGRFVAMTLGCNSAIATQEDYANARLIAAAPDLVDSLMVVCHALAAWRDGADIDLEELKYTIVDRALELAIPGFDGGVTVPEELHASIAEWITAIAKATGGAE